ncbi:MAG: isopentenyl phosphate kinase [Anaerolineales bacterium]
MNGSLIFLKLGGSLITEKDKPSTALLDVIKRAAAEIAAAYATNPAQPLLLGHGSGSFGHFPAKQHGTRTGVGSEAQWHGFIEVRQQAASLNRIVMDALTAAGLPALAFPPSAMATASDGRITHWELRPIRAALDAHLLPVVYGDVAFDTVRGGTILSTEDLFVYLAAQLQPSRLLLAGDEEGVYTNYPQAPLLIEEITPSSYPEIAASLQGAVAPDVTGGMAGKVQAMLDVVTQVPSCEVMIFSGLEPGNIARALLGASFGTRLHAV